MNQLEEPSINQSYSHIIFNPLVLSKVVLSKVIILSATLSEVFKNKNHVEVDSRSEIHELELLVLVEI